MKSPIPEDLRGKTISNIIVVCVGILVAIGMLHLSQIWSVVRRVMRVALPLLVGFSLAFILIPAVSRVEGFFARLFSRFRPRPKLYRALAITLVYIVVLALVSGFFAVLVPQIINSLKSVVRIITSATPSAEMRWPSASRPWGLTKCASAAS